MRTMQKYIPEIKKLIIENIDKDSKDFVLKNSGKIDSDVLRFVAEQIESRRKAKGKIDSWIKNFDLIFPKPLSVEQSSSELTALYKASLVSGKSGIDLTGGFGVDSFYFAEVFKSFYHNELNSYLSYIVKYNFNILEVKNANFTSRKAEEILPSLKEKVDFIFIDPGRRDGHGRKMVSLKDCSPDVIEMLLEIEKSCDKLMIKASPMLDISLSLKQLGAKVSEVHVVSVKNECKEIIYLLDFLKDKINIKYFAVNISNKETSIVEFKGEKSRIDGTPIQKYIFEPGTSMMKLGFWSEIEDKFGIKGIYANTHLYTADEPIENFPGRVFRLTEEVKPKAKEISEKIPSCKANVITKNYPLDSKALAKKMKLKDGGEDYVLAFRDNRDKPRVFWAERV
jgi:hypothetical protein